MVIALMIILAQTETTFREPAYFAPTIMATFLVGAVTSLVAAVLGFARSKAFGPATRWFSFAAVCLILFHVQFLALGFGVLTKDNSLVFTILTFFNFFILLAAVCLVIGFIRLTSPR
jgi:hypothetical protein